MKIAIPSDDKVNICKHFGRTKGFVIVELQNNEVVNKEYKENTFTGHAQGHHHNHGDEHNHQHGGGHHSHQGIFDAIGDCDAVVAGGMGRRLYDDFGKTDIKVYVTKENSIDTALQLFINEKLDNNSDNCCNH